MDSIEYNLASGSGLPSSSSQSSISNVSSSARQSISKQSSPSTTSSGFNPFSFIKKKSEPVQVINSQQQNSLENKLKQQKTDMKTISQYIKSFELIVIKSLRQYTITTSVNLQTKILDLLIQLIFLNVDYCLLDSDKVFLDYVLKQFEYLEQKRVGDAPNNEDPLSTSLAKTYLVDLYESFDFETSTLDALNPFDLDTMLNKLFSNFENYYNQNSSSLSSGGSYSTSPLTSNLSLKQQENLQAHLLIPKMFDFLILLSNEKKNPSPGKTFRQTGSAGLLTIPKIIQLCDNLIASENSPHTHSIPALRPLVIDLFLNRSNEDSRELEMQHDVIMMTMLRLIQYPSVWPLLTISVLKLKKENDEKWKKVSRQIFDHVFEAIKSFKLKFHEFNGFDLRSVRRYSASHVPCLESVKLLIQLFSSLCPQVYRPIDSVIISLFESAKGLMTNEGDLTSNLCLFISHLYLLLTNASEDQILIRVHYLSQQISIMYQEANILMKGEQKLLSRKASSDFTGDDRSEMSSMSTSASTSSSNLSNFDEIDDTDFDLSDSALFVGKFLLKILDISFNCVRKKLKFNFNSFISANNLTSSTTSGAFLRDLDLNMFKDLNTIQHLISNQIQFLLYILTSGNFNKISAALIKLINNKNANYDTKKFRSSYDEQNRPETNDDEDEDSNQNDDEIDDFGFNSSKFVYQTNKFILFKLSKTNPYLSSMWQYVLLQCHYHDPEYWLLSLESCDKEELLIDSSTSSSNNTSLNPNIQESEIPIRRNKNKDKSYKSYDYNQFKKIQVQFHQHSKIPTLNEKLFKYLTLTIYCDNLTSNQNQFDTTSNLTMLIINNLVDLFELASSEATVIDLFSSIHRNSSASSLFIQSINSNWVKLIEKNKLYLLESCLKSVEGVHLSSSGNLLNLLIEKFFNLPYLSLVRYADHIACQRVEMMHSLTLDELAMQLTDKNLSVLDKFFDNQLKNAGRHQRLLSLLEQLKRNLNNDNSNSPINSIRQSQSIEFFSLYLQTSKVPCDLDKEWFYNIVRSACCYSSNTDIISDSSSLKSKQCALMLKNLDISNCECIINDKNFRLSILKDCLLISALKTQNNIDKLPSALKQAKNLFKDFTHPLWISSTQFLFKKIEIVAQKIPKPIQISISQVAEVSHVFKDRFSSSNPVDLTNYDNKINDLLTEFNFSTLIHPLTESINSYLKSIRQFTYLDNVLKESDYKNIIDFGFFQLAFVNYLSFHKNELISIQCLNESFLCILNVLIDQKLINILSKNTTYSTLVSYLIKDLYQLIIVYFFKIGDENLLTTPRLNEKIDYFGEAQKYSNDVLFNKISLETLLKLRFIINNQSFREKIPFKMRDLIEKIYIGLCRLPVLDRFIRIPDCLWNQNFKLDYSQLLRTDTTALPPLDYLKDPHVLKDYLRHILLIGWTTRNQFEYEYVNMLTFFHNISEDYFLPMSSQANSSEFLTSMNQDQNSNQIINQLPVEEIKERNKCISLLIKGLSTWLIKSSLTPISGNSLNSLYEQVSRNKSPGFLSSPIGKQYGQIKKTIESFNRYNNFTQLNSISISNNSNLLYMLDPTLIDDSDRDARPILDFTQPQPPETLTNLIKISNNLSARYNLLFSTNIERVMLNNLPTNTNSYYYFTQISLEGMLKFLGQWNKNDGHANRLTNSFGESIQNFVTNQIDEVSNKVADLLNDETPTPSFNQNIYEPINNSYLIQRSFNRNSLDITSVLRTVLDYYESFFRIPSTQLKLDIFKSMLYLSNCLFDSRQQYESLCQKLQANFEFLNLFIQQDNDPLMPAVNDLIDESTLGLAIYGDCLSRCCLHTTRDGQSMSSKEFERLNKLVENGLKSTSVIIKISTLHGLIYWLESISLGYLSNDAKILIDHLCKQIYLMKDPGYYLTSNSRYLSSLWSVGFYLIENCLDSIRDAQNFCSTFIKLTYQILNDSNTPYFLFYQLYLGLERLLLSCMVPSFEINTIQKLIINKLYDEQKALCLISLTITSLYANNPGKQMNYWYDIIGQQFKVSENTSSSNSPSQADNPIVKDSKISLPQILELNAYPELQSHLLKVLEVATSFLDRMKSSSTSKEASLYASILPKILCDFLPPHDLLNKLITEFLNSSQHPYPEAVAFVLYKCFDLLQEKGMQTQIQEWCLLSLSNFLQRTSIYESIWLTSCLLVSASQNQWLKSTFPFLLNRYCVFDTIDRAIFYMSVIEFIKQFDDDAQVKSIINAFESHAKPGTPYEEFVKLFVSKSDLN